jgi:DNA invertase Pin-like site-specific DNA recombinase
MIKVAAYLRVSTAEQTYENQRPAIETYCKQQGWQLTMVYAENESAWKAGHQHELARLIDDLKSGKRRYDRLIIVSLDRLSRQGPGTVIRYMDTLKRLNCQIVSLRESWTDSPFSEPMYLLVSWFAKWESESRSARTKAGQERARLHGTKSGTGIGKRGKDKNPNGRHKAGYLQRWSVNKRPPVSTAETTVSDKVDK